MEKYIHAFWHVEGMDYLKLSNIWKSLGDFERAWRKASVVELRRTGLVKEMVERILVLREKLDLEAAMDKLWRNDIVPIGRNNAEFPQSFAQIEQAPFLIYRKGAELRFGDLRMVGIVGMRKATVAGEKLAFSVGKVLGERGCLIVSGLAYGIDAAAHQGALAASARTIGILASGIGKITPGGHYGLAEKMLAGGGSIISEYPVTSDAFKYRFLERNRLIAALSEQVIVVEAAQRSGALITARLALEYGKNVLAFPGDPGKVFSQGCNNLIRKGEAGLVSSVGEVLESLELQGVGERGELVNRVGLSEKEKLVLEVLRRYDGDEEALKETLFEPEQIQIALSNLEIGGWIDRVGWGNWAIK